MMSIFDPNKISNLEIRNRFVSSAAGKGLATEDSQVTPEMINFYHQLAKGGVGLIITRFVYVSPDGKPLKYSAGIYSDEHVEGFKKLVKSVHEEGAKIALQIGHAGRQAPPGTIRQIPVAPSALRDRSTLIKPRALKSDEIMRLIDDFVLSGLRGAEAGFDAIQLYCAHGFLINQFLSPYMNKRKDEWGGELKNRMRFLSEIIKGLMENLGDKLPIFVKINSQDFVKGGLTIDDTIKISKELERLGISASELSGGIGESYTYMIRGDLPFDLVSEVLKYHSTNNLPYITNLFDKTTFKILNKLAYTKFIKRLSKSSYYRKAPPFKEAYFLEFAKKLKPTIKIPLILVGGMRSLEVMEKILNEGYADMISLSRPFLREPNLVNRFKDGKTKRASCTSCNRCLFMMTPDKPVRCYNT